MCSKLCTRIGLFVITFGLCIFFGAMGSTYMVSAVQSLQRQYQISSKTSGMLISAHEIGYIPSVVILSYIGSKGNRARWIGFGTLLVAVGNLIISSPHFIFPQKEPRLNETMVKELIKTPEYLRATNSSNAELLDHPWFKAVIPVRDLAFIQTYADKPDSYLDVELPEGTREMFQKLAKEEHEIYGTTLEVLEGNEPVGRLFDELRELVLSEASELHRQYLIGNATLRVSFCSAEVNRMKDLLRGNRCDKERNTNSGAVGLIAFALVMVGIGHSLPWSLGVPLVDDNVDRASMPLYFGLIYALKFLGPLLGFFLGGICNKMYYNFKPPIGLEPSDPRWIGAWWLGFIICGLILLFPGLIMSFCFSAGKAKVATEEGKEDKKQLVLVDRHLSTKEKRSFCEEAKHFFGVLLLIIQKPVYTGTVLGRFIDAFSYKGFIAFMPKFFEDHYGISASKANTMMGGVGLVMLIGGLAAGSIMTKKFKLEGRKAATCIAVCSLIAAILGAVNLGFGCESFTSQVGLRGKETNLTFVEACKTKCLCQEAKMQPVCSRSGDAYYSPCHAGCKKMTVLADDKLNFTQCQCAKGGQVSKDFCSDNCTIMLVLFMGFGLVSGFIGSLALTPSTLLFLRAVPPEHRSVALGLNAFIISIGTLCSPILYGSIIDAACLLWSETCGHRGRCMIYDPKKLLLWLNLVVVIGKVVALSMDVWVWVYAKGLKVVTEDNDESTDNNTNMELEDDKKNY